MKGKERSHHVYFLKFTEIIKKKNGEHKKSKNQKKKKKIKSER